MISDEGDSDADEDFCDECEIRFAPPGGTDVKDVFNIIQECNKLHPNTNDGEHNIILLTG